jgi:hypothetical protein
MGSVDFGVLITLVITRICIGFALSSLVQQNNYNYVTFPADEGWNCESYWVIKAGDNRYSRTPSVQTPMINWNSNYLDSLILCFWWLAYTEEFFHPKNFHFRLTVFGYCIWIIGVSLYWCHSGIALFNLVEQTQQLDINTGWPILIDRLE